MSSHQNIAELPQEILINIFSFLPSNDLISLSELCRSFSDAINSCTKLMTKFRIFIFDTKKNQAWKPMRRYSSITIDSQHFEDFLKIFNDIGSDLEVLDIRYSSFELKTLKDILMSCENVKELTLHDVKLTGTEFSEPLPKLKLNSLNFLNLDPQSVEILKILENSTVINLKMEGFFAHSLVLKSFLMTQSELKSFQLFNKLDTFLLFDDNSLRDVNFRLSKLQLSNFDFYIRLPFFRDFIATQADSLESFETNDWKVFNVMEMTKLKSVVLPNMIFRNQQPFSTVQELTISIDVSDNWARQFPNVKRLTIIQLFVFKFNKTAEVEDFQSLDELEIQYNTVEELNLPTVRKLNLCFMSDMEKTRPFVYENSSKLEELRIVRCKDAEWLADYLKCDGTKLKLLQINGTELSDECLGVIDKSRFKVEKLEIL